MRIYTRAGATEATSEARVTQMKKPYPAGSILMDAPEHSSMDQLVDYAHDVDRWAIWANAILDPNHA